MKGPDAATCNASQTGMWGEARDARGQQYEIRIITLDGYSLTVFSSLAIAQHLLSNNAPPGCRTPAGFMGEYFDVKARFVAPISIICGTGRSTL